MVDSPHSSRVIKIDKKSLQRSFGTIIALFWSIFAEFEGVTSIWRIVKTFISLLLKIMLNS